MPSIRVVALFMISGLIFMLTATFIHQHHYLSRAFHLQLATHRVSTISDIDWNGVWKLARDMPDKAAFLANLQSLGVTVDLKSSMVNASKSVNELEADLLAMESQLFKSDYENLLYADFSSNQSTATKLPPPLNEKLVKRYTLDNTVIVTWANYALWDFVSNWVKHLERLQIYNYMVGAMDIQIGEELVKRELGCFAMFASNESHTGVGTDHLAWGGKSFHKMGRQKISLAQAFMAFKVNLLLVDVDVVLLRNPIDYFKLHPQADVLVSSDSLASTLAPGDPGLEDPITAGAPMNIGLMFFRYSSNMSAMVDEWLRLILKDDTLWDQNAFNELARKDWNPYEKFVPENKRIFKGWSGRINVGILPVASFSGGHTFFIQKLYEVKKVPPYAVHCTFQYGANTGKRNRMREAMIFEDEEQYYTGASYVSMDVPGAPDKSAEEFNKTANLTDMMDYHRQGVMRQVQPVFAALGIAVALGRVVIMPRFACYCDRYWMPLERCRVPGAVQERLPFVCPMDHVLDPIFFTDSASSLNLTWREYSLLENPRCPDSIKSSRMTIFTSTAVKVPTEKFFSGRTSLLLPPKMLHSDIVRALAPYASTRVFHFTDAVELWGGFDTTARETGEQFLARIRHLTPEYKG